MSFNQMKRDDLYTLAVDGFAVEVSETANKAQIIAALMENGVTWDMAKTFDENARAVAEAEEALEDRPGAVITAAATKPEAVKVVDPVALAPLPVLDRPTEGYITLYVPEGVDGFVKDGKFYPGEPVQPAPVVVQGPRTVSDTVLIKMDRENPTYVIRGYRFTQSNPFALVNGRDADYILSHEDGFKVATPREAKEFYG